MVIDSIEVDAHPAGGHEPAVVGCGHRERHVTNRLLHAHLLLGPRDRTTQVDISCQESAARDVLTQARASRLPGIL